MRHGIDGMLVHEGRAWQSEYAAAFGTPIRYIVRKKPKIDREKGVLKVPEVLK